MAGEIFDQAIRRTNLADVDSNIPATIGFNQFRRSVVPGFAKLKNIDDNALIEKLAMCELPTFVVTATSNTNTALKSTDTEKPPEQPKLDGAAVESNCSGTSNPTGIAFNNNVNLKPEDIQALTQLQSLTRAKLAKKSVHNLREVR